MDNLNFIKEILMTDHEYWIVAKKDEINRIGRHERLPDQIIFISIPRDIKRGLKYEEITLQEVEKLYGTHIDQNIFITDDYPPFQLYISFRDIYRGYPVEKNIKEFLIKALALKSTDLYKYKELMDIELERGTDAEL